MNAGKNGHPTIVLERDMQQDPNPAHTDIIFFQKMLTNVSWRQQLSNNAIINKTNSWNLPQITL